MATLNEPLPQGTGSVNTLRSGEDSMKLNELMEICTKLSERVLALENIKTAQDLEISNLKKRVKKLEKKKKSRTPQLKRRLFKVRIESSADKSLGDQEDASNQGRNIAEFDQDEGISFVQEDVETQGSAPITTDGVSIMIKSKEKSKEKGVASETATRPTRGVIMKEASETASRPIVPPQQQLDLKDKGKVKMEILLELTSNNLLLWKLLLLVIVSTVGEDCRKYSKLLLLLVVKLLLLVLVTTARRVSAVSV
ncbi:hypothetical protein Tco_0807343 [Tanacetum coccineum]